jgi:CIC family chloride channel protein
MSYPRNDTHFIGINRLRIETRAKRPAPSSEVPLDFSVPVWYHNFFPDVPTGLLKGDMENLGESKPPQFRSNLFRQLLKFKLWLVEHFPVGERQFTLVWAALIGLLGALASELFRRATDLLHYMATGSNSEIISSFARLPFWQRVVVPTMGGLLAGVTLWLGNRLTSRLRQKSTTDYMEAIVVGSGAISVPASLVKSLSALFSISTGASIGREGPLVQISSLVASLIAKFRGLPIAQRRQLVACGAAAGIASAYNAPIAGSFFVAEIILGTVVVEALGPLILAAVVATFTAQVLHGGGPIYKSPGFTLQTPLELIPLVFVGAIAGFIAPVYLSFLRLVQRLFSKVDLPGPAKLALGGAIVGGLACVSPDVCGNGQGLLSILFHQNWYSDEILAIFLLKLVATAATFGSGAVGGVFTPTLFVGAALGMLYGRGILYSFGSSNVCHRRHGFFYCGHHRCAADVDPDGLRVDSRLHDCAAADGQLRRRLLLQQYF